MARTRSENYGDIQQGILAKAAALYSAHGYMRASIADLADACQISRGALYHYFDSKEAILFAMLDAHLNHMITQIEGAIVQADEPREQFRRVIRTVVEVNAASPHEQRVLLNDLQFLAPDQQKYLKKLGRQIVAIIADLLVRMDTQRKIVGRSKQVYTMSLFGIINYTYTWYDPKGPISPAEFADLAVDLFLNGFAPAAARSRSAKAREVA